jgi:hypothetical protein
VPTFRDHTEPYLSIYTPVLPADLGVCEICHGAPGEGFHMPPAQFSDHAADVLRRGTVQVDHRRADDLGFLVDADVDGARILLLDDTLTTGARVQSAASALQLAGGQVVGAVVVGRVIRPEWSKESAALWSAARSRRFSFDTCCLERDVPPEPPFDLDAS